MAKLKAPLLSLGASGAIGKSIVFFPWKGIDAVREYVIPANPQSSRQTTQRDRLKEAIRLLRLAQAFATYPFREDDATAYALWASTYPTPSTWFNMVCKHVIEMMVAGDVGRVFRNITTAPGTKELVIGGNYHAIAMTGGNVVYGTSKTAMIKTQACSNITATSFAATLTGLTTGVKYFWQFVGTAPSNAVGVRSGIYYGYPN